MKTPAPLVVESNLFAVCTWLSETRAFGRTPPVESVRVPWICPTPVWAIADVQTRAMKLSSHPVFLNMQIDSIRNWEMQRQEFVVESNYIRPRRQTQCGS